MTRAYFNEIEPFAAQWLRNLIDAGLLPAGDVDERTIVDVQPSDLDGYTQCHFFAGIGGWAYAARLAGWSDDRPLWTGSCPCQPFSVAGKGLGTDDPRHLWPHFFRLISACRPAVVMGEQVAGAAGYGWLDGVRADLAGEGYACRGVDIPACAVDAPHIRSRLYWVASEALDDAASARRAGHAGPDAVGAAWDAARREGLTGRGGDGGIRLDDTHDTRLEGHAGHGADRAGWPGAAGSVAATGGGDVADHAVAGCKAWPSDGIRTEPRHVEGLAALHGDARNGTFWSDAVWLTGADRKARRAQPGLPLLAHGISGRVGRLRAYGNAIVPQLAAEVIGAFMECRP